MEDALVLCKACFVYIFVRSEKGSVWTVKAETHCGLCKTEIRYLDPCHPVSKQEVVESINRKKRARV